MGSSKLKRKKNPSHSLQSLTKQFFSNKATIGGKKENRERKEKRERCVQRAFNGSGKYTSADVCLATAWLACVYFNEKKGF